MTPHRGERGELPLHRAGVLGPLRRAAPLARFERGEPLRFDFFDELDEVMALDPRAVEGADVGDDAGDGRMVAPNERGGAEGAFDDGRSRLDGTAGDEGAHGRSKIGAAAAVQRDARALELRVVEPDVSAGRAAVDVHGTERDDLRVRLTPRARDHRARAHGRGAIAVAAVRTSPYACGDGPRAVNAKHG